MSSKIRKKATTKDMLKYISPDKRMLNLGSGRDYRKGWVNLENNMMHKADSRHDLDKFPYPFKNEEFDFIYCSHILEHVRDFRKTFLELLRITKRKGIIYIRVPHFSNGSGYSNLDHKRFFGWNTFDMLIKGDVWEDNYDFKIINKRYNYHSFQKFYLRGLINFILNKIVPPRYYERHLYGIFPMAGELIFVLQKN